MVEVIRLNNEIQEFRPLFHVWRCLTRWWNIWPQIKIGISFTWIDKRAQPYHFLISQRNRRKRGFLKNGSQSKGLLSSAMTYFCCLQMALLLFSKPLVEIMCRLLLTFKDHCLMLSTRSETSQVKNQNLVLPCSVFK